MALALALATAGCSADHPAQIETVQAFASALRGRQPRLACSALVPRLQDEINCDSVLVPLLHYSPGFPGSKVSRRGRTSGWRFSSQVVVPVRFEGPDGSGKLDVTMQHIDGFWRIVLIAPVR